MGLPLAALAAAAAALYPKDAEAAKFSEDEVQRIRKDTHVNRAIAKEYGVGHQAISKIKRGLRWTHV